MALGQAAGIAAHLARTEKVTPRQVNRDRLQRTLLAQGAVLTYLRDVTPAHPQWTALQIAGCHGCFPELDARPDAPIDGTTAVEWAKRAGKMPTPPITTATTRAAYAALLFG